jgi:predicted TIM-barrel fold metal-dependent hydrolase
MRETRIVDSHTHFATSKDWPPEKWAKKLEEIGVDKVLVSTSKFHLHDFTKENENLCKQLAIRSDFYIPFCTVNPWRGVEAVKELKRAIKMLGMKGLKLHPVRQGFFISEPPRFSELIEETANLGVPVIFHDGTPPRSTPLQICNLAEDHPEATIILGHSGLRDLWRNAISGAKRAKNVFLCTTGPPIMAIKKMVEQIGVDRIIFGSDASPGNTSVVDYNLNKIRLLGIREEEKMKILGLNILKLLEI